MNAKFSASLWLMLILCASCGGDESASEIDTQTESTISPTSVPISAPIPQSLLVVVSQIREIWHPPIDTTWQWQLIGQPTDASFDVDMYDIDLFDNESSVVADLQIQGRKVVCYLNAGGWENWRPDAGLFPLEVIGKNLDDWEGKRWLDIRRLDVLGPILETRFETAETKASMASSLTMWTVF